MNFITFESSRRQLKFDEVHGQLRQIIYKNHLLDTYSPLWRLLVKTGEAVREVSLFDAMDFRSQFEEERLHLFWQNDEFMVKVTLEGVEGKIQWHIDVRCMKDESSLLKVVFPVIGGIKVLSPGGEEDYFVLPWQNGWLIRNPIHTFFSHNQHLPFWAGRGGNKYENEYPAQYSYQFSAYYSPDRVGYYFCTEDSEAYIKTIGYYYNEEDQSFTYALTNYPENMGRIREYHMPYKFVFQLFEGDWQTAAAIYRKWAVLQKWCSSRLTDRNLPENLIKTDLWRINHTNYQLGTRTKEYFDTAVALKDRLDCNLALHWYGWNRGEHDLNYPEYIRREQEEWPKQLTEWNERFSSAGIVKLPYVNARLWDAKTKSWAEENAEAAAIKNENDQIPEEPWNPKALLKPMCPSTSLWKEKVRDFGSRIIQAYKFDGLYIDQVASYNATLCFDSSHVHPVGGGQWWNASYHAMVAGLRDRVGVERILTTESCCESYLDLFDLFLTIDMNLQKYFLFTEYSDCEAIPLFNMLYGEYALSYGSICRFSDTVEEFEFNFIRNLLWGILPTVEGVDQEQLSQDNASEYLAIVKKGVDFYKENKDLILYGRLSEIPKYQCEPLSIHWTGPEKSFSKEIPCILAVIWQDTDERQYCLAYNFATQAKEICIRNMPIQIKEKEIKIVGVNPPLGE